MSLIANLSSAPSALPPVNVHPHGHKRGLHIESSDDSSSDTAAQIPPGAAQNLFGSLLQSLEQVIGIQATTPGAATATPATAATPAGAPSGAATTAGATASTAGATTSTAATSSSAGAADPSASSASSLLKNYLTNLSQNLQANGSQAAKNAGSSFSVNA
jgi:hypothetical protein